MNAYLEATQILLVVLVPILWWRVWRLDGYKREVYDDMRQMQEINNIGRASKLDVLRAENRLHECLNKDRAKMHALARALGYEWERTEAKEGWEKKVTLADAIDWAAAAAPFRAYNEKCYADELWDSYGKNRRKADRRKPVEPPAKKKPRRATH